MNSLEYYLFIFMFYLLAIVGFIYLVARLNKLEKEIDLLKKQPHSVLPPVPAATQLGTMPQTTEAMLYTPVAVSPAAVDLPPNAFMAWLKEDFMVKLGAFLLLIAFGWFVSYAFANNWIGPVGRVVLGILAGIAFMLGGLIRIQKERHQGAIFTVLGSTIVLLTVFAAREMYDLFTPLTALAVMFLSIVLVAKVAVVYRSKSMAVSGLVLAGIAPFLTNSPDSNALEIFSYLTVVVVGSLWVLAKIDAIILQFAAFVLVVLYSIPYISNASAVADIDTALAFGFLFTVIFFISNIMSIMHRSNDDADLVHLVIASGTGLYLASWISEVVPTEWQSLLYAAWAIVFAFGAFVVFTRTNKRVPFFIYGGVSIGLLAAATAVIFEGPFLTLAYTIEVTTLVVLALLVLNSSLIARRISLLFIGPVMLSLESMSAWSWQEGVLHQDFFILLIVMICLGFSAHLLIEKQKEVGEPESKTSAVLAIASSLYGLALVWLVSHAILLDDQATMVSLLIYTALGITLFVQGQSSGNKYTRIGGTALITFVVLRLLFIDVWQMEISGRIITFLLVGVLLISTAFIKKLNHGNPAE